MLLEGDDIDWNKILIAVINLFYKICMDFIVHIASGFQPIKKWFQSTGEIRSPRCPGVPSAGTGIMACGSCLCSLGKGRHVSQGSSSAGGGPPAHPASPFTPPSALCTGQKPAPSCMGVFMPAQLLSGCFAELEFFLRKRKKENAL